MEQLDNKTIRESISGYNAEEILSGKSFELMEAADDELTRERILSALREERSLWASKKETLTRWRRPRRTT